jgi:DNA-binding transcriptional ArsR family regulator
MAAKDRKPPRGSGEPGRGPRLESYTLSSLDQIRVLADPLRIRILEALSRERTTKQVAEHLGEKPTKLYHHVDALEKVGLVELSRTRPNRGTLEKYYVAVAHSFRTDSRVFQPAEGADAGEEAEALRRMMTTILDTTSAELAAIIDRGAAAKAIEEEGIVSFLEIHASAEELAAIRDRLYDLVQTLAATCERSPDKATDDGETGDAKRYRLMLAYYPLGEASPPGSDKKRSRSR